ncbi:4283_t:CDS:2 [Entrophospora sp. SA101]|nr:4283_t:CDS:2 [Entrophospora sp. SA101]
MENNASSNNINANTNNKNIKGSKTQQSQKAGCKNNRKKVLNNEKTPKRPLNAFFIFVKKYPNYTAIKRASIIRKLWSSMSKKEKENHDNVKNQTSNVGGVEDDDFNISMPNNNNDNNSNNCNACGNILTQNMLNFQSYQSQQSSLLIPQQNDFKTYCFQQMSFPQQQRHDNQFYSHDNNNVTVKMESVDNFEPIATYDITNNELSTKTTKMAKYPTKKSFSS